MFGHENDSLIDRIIRNQNRTKRHDRIEANIGRLERQTARNRRKNVLAKQSRRKNR